MPAKYYSAVGRFYLKGEQSISMFSFLPFAFGMAYDSRESSFACASGKKKSAVGPDSFALLTDTSIRSCFGRGLGFVASWFTLNLFPLQARMFIDGFNSGDLRSIDETCTHVVWG